jgi:pre-rRNA-processing protein IPI3
MNLRWKEEGCCEVYSLLYLKLLTLTSQNSLALRGRKAAQKFERSREESVQIINKETPHHTLKMLAEHLVASIGAPFKATGTSIAKDAAIFVHEYQPSGTQRTMFKKSATPQNCLAVSATHIFAAQADKAVVNVYNRERGNQEATIPFTERINCLTLACEDTILVLGTTEGRVFLWEVTTGRQVTTAQSHLQAVNQLAVDAASNFLVSASADSTCHVWSIPALLSFSNDGAQPLAPLRTFSTHRSSIKALAIGHSESFQNIAITAAHDKTCLVWDYHTNAMLRTFLLPSVPTSIAIDAADRAFYVGYEDGGVHRIDLLSKDETDVESIQTGADALTPVQPKTKAWSPPDASTGSVLCLDLSFDGTVALAGHQSGTIIGWDIATGHMKSFLPQGPLPGPVMNLKFLPVSGFQSEAAELARLDVVVKPKFGAFQNSGNGNGSVPGNYAFNTQLLGSIAHDSKPSSSIFTEALFGKSFPSQLLDEGLSELAAWGEGPPPEAKGKDISQLDDFMALDEPVASSGKTDAKQQSTDHKSELDALRRVNKTAFAKIQKLQTQVREQQRAIQKGQGKNSSQKNGAADTDGSSDEDEDMSSSEDSE